MCDSCSLSGMNRRQFMVAGSWMTAAGFMGLSFPAAAFSGPIRTRKEKRSAHVEVVFLYPPADVVHEGNMEDGWARHRWFTYPSYQFAFDEQRERFSGRIREMAQRLDVKIAFASDPLWREADVGAYIERVKALGPDAVMVINFYNSLSKAAYQIATEAGPTAIVYTPVGAQHQLPFRHLDTAEGLHFIQGIEDWDGLEEGLRAVRAKKMLTQSRMLRVRSGEANEALEPFLGMEIVGVPATEYNDLFDSIQADRSLEREAMAWKRRARRVEDVSDSRFVEAMRAHRTVHAMLERYGADAITMECLMLEHRKPCISFCLNNGDLIPSGCENDLNGTLSLMLGRWLLDRAGFLHNPGFNPRDNQYFGSHCTCALKLHGPKGPEAKFWIRPFTHQLPKTPALDVQWKRGEPVMLSKYHSDKNQLTCWTGKVIESPTMPPTGGCATRVLVEMDDVSDVRDVYPGPHPVLFCGSRSEARRWRAFARMYRLQFQGNVVA